MKKVRIHTGFIQIIPMIVLAIGAITSFIIISKVQKDQQDLRSRATATVPCKIKAGKENVVSCQVTCPGITSQATCDLQSSCCHWTTSVAAAATPHPTTTSSPDIPIATTRPITTVTTATDRAGICCPKEGSGDSGIYTCKGLLSDKCPGQSVCEWKISCTGESIPTSTTTPTIRSATSTPTKVPPTSTVSTTCAGVGQIPTSSRRCCNGLIVTGQTCTNPLPTNTAIPTKTSTPIPTKTPTPRPTTTKISTPTPTRPTAATPTKSLIPTQETTCAGIGVIPTNLRRCCSGLIVTGQTCTNPLPTPKPILAPGAPCIKFGDNETCSLCPGVATEWRLFVYYCASATPTQNKSGFEPTATLKPTVTPTKAPTLTPTKRPTPTQKVTPTPMTLACSKSMKNTCLNQYQECVVDQNRIERCVSSQTCNREILDYAAVGLGGSKLPSTYVPPNLVDASIISNAVVAPGVQVQSSAAGPLSDYASYLSSKGYTLYILSGYRSYQSQDEIHRANLNGSAPPGESQHQTGLAVDVQRYDSNGVRQDLSDELINAAPQFGISHPLAYDRPHFFVLSGCIGNPDNWSSNFNPIGKTDADYAALNVEITRIKRLCESLGM